MAGQRTAYHNESCDMCIQSEETTKYPYIQHFVEGVNSSSVLPHSMRQIHLQGHEWRNTNTSFHAVTPYLACVLRSQLRQASSVQRQQWQQVRRYSVLQFEQDADISDAVAGLIVQQNRDSTTRYGQ